MSQYPSPFGPPQELQYENRVGSTTVSRFFNAVYAWMAAGLALTAVVAWFVSTRPDLMQTIFRGPVLIILVLVELALVYTVSAAINKIGTGAATALFMLYAALNGLTLSAIFIVYAHATLAAAFIVTAGTFGVCSLFGYVTKMDLSRFGSFLFMALIGVIIASLVNMFLRSPAFYWLITYVSVFIFVGLTAYDTQKLKMIAIQTEGAPELAARLSVVGALSLYLDFINLFLLILRLMGNRRN
jgi:FtsH-binding integral membrane protein